MEKEASKKTRLLEEPNIGKRLTVTYTEYSPFIKKYRKPIKATFWKFVDYSVMQASFHLKYIQNSATSGYTGG